MSGELRSRQAGGAPHTTASAWRGVGAVVLLLGLVACDAQPEEAGQAPDADTPVIVDAPTPGSGGETPTGSPTPGEVEVTAQVAVDGLEVPWELVWAGEEVYVTQRDTGELLSVDLASNETNVVDQFDVAPAGEGGLLGLAAHPEDPSTLYAYLSSATGGDNRVVRFSPGEADDAEVIVDGIPHAAIHNGGRLAFGPDDLLYVTTGDARQGSRAQNASSLGGAILRLTPDGDVPADNPIPGSPVYATGIRNTQGLAWTGDGELVAAEFGPDVDDEINVIQPGAAYGWPQVTGDAGREAFTDPIFVRQPPQAAWSGIEVLVDGAIPQWEGDAFAAALRGKRLWHLELGQQPRVTSAQPRLADAYGRLRHVTQGPQGALWLLTSNRDGRGAPQAADDRIIRLGPPR